MPVIGLLALGATVAVVLAIYKAATSDAKKGCSKDKSAGSAGVGCQKDTNTAPIKKSPTAGKSNISESAYKMIGTSTAQIDGTENGTLGCAAAVSLMFKNATGEDILPGKPMVTGTGELYQGLSKDPRFEKVSLKDAQPGDIVVTARGTEAGHTGVVGNNNEIISNSSNGFRGSAPGTIQNNYTIATWQKSVSPRNPDQTSAFRYIGQ